MRFLPLLLVTATTATAQTQPHTLQYAPGKSITLTLPQGLDIALAATGLKRPRFFAQSPDGRIFVTTMYNLADNTRGAVYILDGFNPQTHTFARTTPYLQHLRNPNNLAFYTDEHKQTWLYVPLTDKLVRYRYNPGDNAPTGPAQVLTRYPDYGLNYKYGGWHLTRTVAVATLHGRTRIYVTAGSSCNYCRELEAQRASLTVMDPDGTHQQILAHGLRNAVDLRFISNLDGGALFVTNMGDDHLGDKLPEDTLFKLDSNAHPGPIASVRADAPSTVNYGWPTCYFANGKPTLDHTPLPTNPGPNDSRADAPKPLNSEPGAASSATTDGPSSAKAGGPSVPQHGTGGFPKTSRTDSIYGRQSSNITAAGTNLAAQQHATANLPDLGPVPAPLTSCAQVPAAYTTFAAHSSPLGLAWFGDDNVILKNSFLIALHGSGHQGIGTGYRLVRLTSSNRTPQDFLTGFLTHDGAKITIHGRPCGLLRLAPDTFLLTDDYLGLIYLIYPTRT